MHGTEEEHIEVWSENLNISDHMEDLRTDGKKKKGKAIPLQAWTGPEGPRRLRLPDFKTIGT
jgi:hypothetical protein